MYMEPRPKFQALVCLRSPMQFAYLATLIDFRNWGKPACSRSLLSWRAIKSTTGGTRTRNPRLTRHFTQVEVHRLGGRCLIHWATVAVRLPECFPHVALAFRTSHLQVRVAYMTSGHSCTTPPGLHPLVALLTDQGGCVSGGA